MLTGKKLAKYNNMSEDDPFYDEVMERNRNALEKREFSYEDPKTGHIVFTALYHLDRGYCCGSGCRHCPYREME